MQDHISIPSYPDGRVTAHNAAAYLGLSEKTLATMRCKGTGPKYIKRGRIFYYLEDLKSWFEDVERVTSTAEQRFKANQPK